MQFMEQLGNIMGLDEVSKELGFDLQTDAILARAEQLAKLEGDRLADKVRGTKNNWNDSGYRLVAVDLVSQFLFILLVPYCPSFSGNRVYVYCVVSFLSLSL